MKQYKFAAALAAALALFAGTAGAQQPPWPQRPIHLVVGFPPGGGVDVMARTISVQLGERLGQPVIVDNRPGAGGNLAAGMVAKAEPDGYNILISVVDSLAIGQAMYNNLQFNVARDLAPVGVVGSVPNVLVVNPAVKANDVKELIALAKSRPGPLRFGSAGNGTTVHMSGELFKSMAGIPMDHVPYRGAAPAMTDLLGGQVDMMFDFLSAAQPQIKAGKLRALGVTTATRSPVLPDVPTIAEAGLPGYAVSGNFGIFAPARTPVAILDRLNREIAAVVHTPEMREKLLSVAARPETMTRAEMDASVKAELAKWAAIVKTTGAANN